MIKKYIPIIALIPMLFLALTPPMSFELDCKINSTFWLWMTFFSGFLAFLFLYQKVSVWLKLLVVWCFISSFLSKAPYMSFSMYWSVIICAYFYVLCRKIEDWTIIKKAVQAIFFFITLLIIMQLFGKDTLLNFNQKTPVVFGSIGNPMMASSFVCILAPFLIFNPLNWLPLGIIAFFSGSSGAILSICAGLGTYAFLKLKRFRIWLVLGLLLISGTYAWQTGDFSYNTIRSGRLPVYRETVSMIISQPRALYRAKKGIPVMGYGIGTFKILFPLFCREEVSAEQPHAEWKRTHNDWLQIPFEIGWGIIFLLGWVVTIFVRTKDPIKRAGLVILATNMCIHFPNRMCQSVFIIVMFLAYCSKGETLWEQSPKKT